MSECQSKSHQWLSNVSLEHTMILGDAACEFVMQEEL